MVVSLFDMSRRTSFLRFIPTPTSAFFRSVLTSSEDFYHPEAERAQSCQFNIPFNIHSKLEWRHHYFPHPNHFLLHSRSCFVRLCYDVVVVERKFSLQFFIQNSKAILTSKTRKLSEIFCICIRAVDFYFVLFELSKLSGN